MYMYSSHNYKHVLYMYVYVWVVHMYTKKKNVGEKKTNVLKHSFKID